MNQFVIYHANCADGLTSAALHQILSPNSKGNVIYLEGEYGKSLEDYPDFTNASVLFLDFSFKEEEFKQLLKEAKDVQVIDHHVTAYEYLSKLIEEDNVFSSYIYDINECGSSLVWKTFKPNSPIPLAVRYVRDQDIYAWEYKEHSVPFCLAVETLDRDLETFYTFWINTLMYSDHISPPSSFIEEGRKLKKLKDNYVTQMIQNFRIKTWLDEEVVFINCPNLFVNAVSDHFRDNTDINYVITYSFRNDGIAFSLRSKKGFSTLPYTFLISKKGGGHECASGAFLSYEDFEKHEIKQLIMG